MRFLNLSLEQEEKLMTSILSHKKNANHMVHITYYINKMQKKKKCKFHVNHPNLDFNIDEYRANQPGGPISSYLLPSEVHSKNHI